MKDNTKDTEQDALSFSSANLASYDFHISRDFTGNFMGDFEIHVLNNLTLQ